MKKFRRIMVELLTLFVSISFIPVAFAHPLGNFTNTLPYLALPN